MAEADNSEKPDVLTLLSAAMADLDHNKDENWDADGKPSLAVLTASMGQEITRVMVDAVDANYHQEPGVIPKTEPGTETVIATAPPVKAEPVIDVETQRAAMKVAADDVAAKTVALHNARDALAVASRKHDVIAKALSKVRNEDLATLNSKIFEANDRAAAERHAARQKFLETTGGSIPPQFASKIDERGANRRSLKRQVSRMGV